jgi:hypothetical protein
MTFTTTQKQPDTRKRLLASGRGKARRDEALRYGPFARKANGHPVYEMIAKSGAAADAARRNESEAEEIARSNREHELAFENRMKLVYGVTTLDGIWVKAHRPLEAGAANSRPGMKPDAGETVGNNGNGKKLLQDLFDGKNIFELMDDATLLERTRKFARCEKWPNWKTFAGRNPKLAAEIKKRENPELAREIKKLDAMVYESAWYWEEFWRGEGKNGLIDAARIAAEAADAKTRPELKERVHGAYMCLKKNGWLTEAGFPPSKKYWEEVLYRDRTDSLSMQPVQKQ